MQSRRDLPRPVVVESGDAGHVRRLVAGLSGEGKALKRVIQAPHAALAQDVGLAKGGALCTSPFRFSQQVIRGSWGSRRSPGRGCSSSNRGLRPSRPGGLSRGCLHEGAAEMSLHRKGRDIDRGDPPLTPGERDLKGGCLAANCAAFHAALSGGLAAMLGRRAPANCKFGPS